ncbi:MAG: glycosyltransferase family 4 protein [Planctomycetota bacterium]|nr:glycosyltransferase family 4 protein [Planctomycetota bacterium]
MSRITLFHPTFLSPGGAEFLCVNQARRLARYGFDVRTVTFDYDPGIWAPQHEGLHVTALPKRALMDARFGFSRLGKLNARAQRARPHLLDADLVLAHNAPCNWMLGSIKLPGQRAWQCNEPPRLLHLRKANPRLAARVDATPGGTVDLATRSVRKVMQVGSKHQKQLQKRVLSDIAMTQQLDTVFAISQFSRDNARAIYGRCEEQVVYPFVRFSEGGTRQGRIGPDGLQILVQTRLAPKKNVDSVIRGFAEYRKGDPRATLHVVGDGPLREHLQELAQELMPPDACLIHGYLSTQELREVYDRCQVFVLLTIDEPFGMVYPEAAARGLLIIGPDHGGPLEILEGGELGHCIDPFESGALVQALEELRTLSVDEVSRRRRAADRSCRARFGEEAVAADLLSVLGLSAQAHPQTAT